MNKCSVPGTKTTKLVDVINQPSSEQCWASLQNIDYLLKKNTMLYTYIYVCIYISMFLFPVY